MNIASAQRTAETFDLGRVVSHTFGVIARNLALFIGLAIILQGIPTLAGGLWRAGAGSVANNGPSAFFATVGGGLLGYFGSVVLQVAVTRATVADLAGERPDFVACLKAGLTLILPMTGLTIMAGLGVGLAALLLIIPGVMLYVAWSVAVPAYVQERIGISASFERSGRLTKGMRWKIFAILLVWLMAAILLQASTDMLAAAARGSVFARVSLTSLPNVVTSVVLATLQAAIYVDLRNVKEGILPRDLEVIFS